MIISELRKKVMVECGALHSFDPLVDLCHKIMNVRIKELEEQIKKLNNDKLYSDVRISNLLNRYT